MFLKACQAVSKEAKSLKDYDGVAKKRTNSFYTTVK